MGRPKKVVNEEVVEKEIGSVKPAMRTEAEELAHQKAIMDGLDSEKAKRDVQDREKKSLEESIKLLRDERERLVMDFNTKSKINQNLSDSIASAQRNLQYLDTVFAKNNEKKLKELETKLKQVEQTDKELQALLKSNHETDKRLKLEMSQFVQERNTNRNLVHAANTALEQNTAMWSNKEKDLIAREEQLKTEKAEFEAYKDSLQPEIARITSIKNDNEALLAKLERQTEEMERIRLSSVREKQLAQEAKAVTDLKANETRQKMLNDEARLRKWEQDLKDQALELAAKTNELNKQLRREKLTELAKSE